MKTTVTRRLEFDAGHRVLRHESKCAHLHGHRYVIDITVRAVSNELDPLGRVVDFGVVKHVLGKWIDEHWDHNILLNTEDPLAALWNQQGFSTQQRDWLFNGKMPYFFQNQNPTAENIAAVFWNVALNNLPAGIRPVRVRVWETPNCWADHSE